MRASLILLFGKTKGFFGKDTARKKTAFLHTLFVENETARAKKWPGWAGPGRPGPAQAGRGRPKWAGPDRSKINIFEKCLCRKMLMSG